MKTHQWLAVVGLAAVLSGCGANEPATMSDYAQDIGRQLDALGAEQTAHSSEISAATDIKVLGAAEQDHAQRMNDHMARMNGVMGSMMACGSGWTSPFDVASFADMMHDLRSECAEHGVFMLSARDIDAARIEEARHQYAAGIQMNKMRRQLGPMVGAGEMYKCSPCPSCGM